MSQPGETSLGTNSGVRREQRAVMTEPVELINLTRSWSAESTSTHNISLRGARVTTQRLWEPGTFLLLKSLKSNFWARARVVYWRGFASRAVIGLEFISHGGDWQQSI